MRRIRYKIDAVTKPRLPVGGRAEVLIVPTQVSTGRQPRDQLAFAILMSSDDSRYNPDMGSIQHRWSCTFLTPATFSAPTMAACRDRSSVMVPLRCTMPLRTTTLSPIGHQSFFPKLSVTPLRIC